MMIADSSSRKITGESVLCGCGKLSGGCTGRSLTCMVWSNLDRGKPGNWLKMFNVLFLGSSYSSPLEVLDGSFGKCPPATVF